jgi:hypothetical protein
MARVLGQSCPKEPPAERDQGLGGVDPRTHQSAARAVRGRGGRLKDGLDFRYPSRPIAQGPGNDSAKRLSRCLRQALGGSDGLSFMR